MINAAKHREIQIPRNANMHIITAPKVQSSFLQLFSEQSLSRYVTNHGINPLTYALIKLLPQPAQFRFPMARRGPSAGFPKPSGAEGGEQRGRVQEERAEEQERKTQVYRFQLRPQRADAISFRNVQTKPCKGESEPRRNEGAGGGGRR